MRSKACKKHTCTQCYDWDCDCDCHNYYANEKLDVKGMMDNAR